MARALEVNGKARQAEGEATKVVRWISSIWKTHENWGEPISSTMRRRNSKKTIENARKKLETSMAPAMPCKSVKNCGSGASNKTKPKIACILEASGSTKLRMGNSEPSNHEDHIAGKGENSLQHYNLVHKFIPMPQAMKIPAAKAAVDKEWEKLEKISAWNLTKVKSKKQVIDEARTSFATVHFASLMDMCHLKKCWIGGKTPEIQRSSCTPRWYCKRRLWVLCSVNTKLRTTLIYTLFNKSVVKEVIPRERLGSPDVDPRRGARPQQFVIEKRWNRIGIDSGIKIIRKHGEWSSAEKTDENFQRCRRWRRTFFDLENVHDCHNGISSIHGKGLPEQLSIHREHNRSHSNTCSTYLQDWCVSKIRSLDWKQLVGKIIRGNTCPWFVMKEISIFKAQRSTSFSDSVLCLVKTPIERCMGTKIGMVKIFPKLQKLSLTKVTPSQWNSSGIFSRDTIRCSSMKKTKVCCWD